MSADTVFEVGDTVKLKSDGHLMTVVSVAEDSITCDWSVRGDVKSKSFPVAALKKRSPMALTVAQTFSNRSRWSQWRAWKQSAIRRIYPQKASLSHWNIIRRTGRLRTRRKWLR